MDPEQYRCKKDLREHVLDRPDTYIGSTDLEESKEWVVEETMITDAEPNQPEIRYEIVPRTMWVMPGFLRIFIEILSNAIDNVWRSREAGIECTAIRLWIDPDGRTRMWNDGLTIPVAKSPHEGFEHLYIPEMIFGVFMSSSNYNDEEERLTSGRNGLGCKLTNCFSKEFIVRTCDPERNLRYRQEWRENMSVRGDPEIKKLSQKTTPYTDIEWVPDFARFDLENYPADLLSLIKRYMFDAAVVTGVTTFFNDEEIPVSSLTDYALCFQGEEETKEIISFQTPDSEVVLMAHSSPICISFVNGVLTSQGGVHVETWARTLFYPLAEKLSPKPKKKEKEIRLMPKEVRSFFALFINCHVPCPKFASQSKERLTGFKDYTLKAEVGERELAKIAKWPSIVEKAKHLIDLKLLKDMKKLDAKKTYKKVDKLEDANLAGKAQSAECTLIVCEGDSARTYALLGIEYGFNQKTGRDYFGIYPVRGKLLNVRNASSTTIGKNGIIQGLIQALGLKLDVDYTEEANFRTLRYGALMIVADADADGLHIEGLIINLLHRLFPSLLKRERSFIQSMRTPLVRVFLKSGEVIPFFRLRAYEEFSKAHQAEIKTVSYYKGLGSSKDDEVAETFGQRVVLYHHEGQCDTTINKAFSNKLADQRKRWLMDYQPDESDLKEDHEIKIIESTFARFIDRELIIFSLEDCGRSLPHVLDGFKESHRKIFYTLLLRKLFHNKPAMKVGQLAGSVAENTDYHHGEQCLYDTIAGMAYDFVGSNNIPLLCREGQFGSRLSGGMDAAKPRYVFTRLEKLAQLIFRAEDEPLLRHRYAEKKMIEPYHYMPILPLILVNGVRCAIGTGWASKVPAHNPLDVISAVRVWIQCHREGVPVMVKDGEINISEFPPLVPWYGGFEGEIVEKAPGKFVTHAVVEENPKGVVVTELPVGVWTDDFRDYLQGLREQKVIASFTDHSTKYKVKFTVVEKRDGWKPAFDTMKHMTSTLHTTNMVCFTETGEIRKFETVEEIVDYFCQIRFRYYVARKAYQLELLREELKWLENSRRFVEEVMEEEIVVFRRPRTEVTACLEERKYDKKTHNLPSGKSVSDYQYLLALHVDSFTTEKIAKLEKEIEKKKEAIQALEALPPEEIWESELLELERAYRTWYQKWYADQFKAKKPKKQTKRGRRGKAVVVKEGEESE